MNEMSRLMMRMTIASSISVKPSRRRGSGRRMTEFPTRSRSGRGDSGRARGTRLTRDGGKPLIEPRVGEVAQVVRLALADAGVQTRRSGRVGEGQAVALAL